MIRNSLIVTPLKTEFSFLTATLEKLGLESLEKVISSIPVKIFPELNLTCAVGGQGKVQFGVQTQFLLHQFPDSHRVFCVGAAGGLTGLNTFDVIIGTKSIEHDYKEFFNSIPTPVFTGCEETINFFKNKTANGKFPFGIHFDAIASGDEDIVSEARANEIHSQTQALAVAWEGAGGARACAFNQKPFVEVRGITDVADNHAAVDFRDNMQKAMSNVANFLMYTVKSF